MASNLTIIGPLPPANGLAAAGGGAPAQGFSALIEALFGVLGAAADRSEGAQAEGPLSASFGLTSASRSATSLQVGGFDIGAVLGTLLPQPVGTTPATPQAAEASPRAGSSPLATLVDALLALDGAGEAGAEEPGLLDRLEQAVEAVLAMLTPADPVSAAATDIPAVTSNAPAQGQAIAPLTLGAQVAADSRAASAPESAPEAAEEIAGPPARQPGTVGQAAPKPDVAAAPLADAISRVADGLPADAPLTAKLRQLSEAVRAGGLDASALSRLGLSPEAAAEIQRLDKAVNALVATSVPQAPAAAAPRGDFAKVHLPMPDAMAGAQPVADAPAEAASRADPAAQPMPAPGRPPGEPRTAPDPKPTGSAGPASEPAAAGGDAADAQTAPLPTLPQRTEPGAAPALHRMAATHAYSAAAPVVVPQVAVEIARQSLQGASRFQIRLDPVDLGRIDVELHVDPAGQTTARLAVERAETLDLLKRDQPALEKALAQAGLDQSRTSLEFSLRQDTGSGRPGAPAAMPDPVSTATADTASLAETAPIQHYRAAVRPGGLDLFA